MSELALTKFEITRLTCSSFSSKASSAVEILMDLLVSPGLKVRLVLISV